MYPRWPVFSNETRKTAESSEITTVTRVLRYIALSGFLPLRRQPWYHLRMRTRRLGVIALAVCLAAYLAAEDGRLQYVRVRTIRTGRQPKDLLFPWTTAT